LNHLLTKNNFFIMKSSFTKFLLVFVCCFAASGVLAQQNHFRWATSAGGGAYDAGQGVTVDEHGNAFVTGYFNGSMNLFDTPFTPESERNTMYLAKVSPQQEMIWSVTAEADGQTGAAGWKTVYKDGFVYLMGDFRGEAYFSSTDFMGTTLSSDNRALFIAKYSDNGVLQWVRSAVTTHAGGMIPIGSDNNLVVDDAGAVYFTTQFRHNLTIDGTLIEPELGSETTRFFAGLIKLDAMGAYQWHWSSTHDLDDRGEALTLTPSGNILFAARYNAALTVSDTTYQNSTGGIALIELQPDGSYVWHHNMYTGTINRVFTRSLQFDQHDNLYIAGTYRTAITWDDDTVFEPESTNNFGFVFKLDSERDIDWTLTLGDPTGHSHARVLQWSAEGNLLVAGEFSRTMVLNDELTLASNDDSTDIFYLVVDPSTGDVTEGLRFGGDNTEFLGSMAVSPQNDVYFMGHFLGELDAFDQNFVSEGSFDIFVVKLGDLHTDATLAHIEVDDDALEGFDPEVLEYEVLLPFDTGLVPVISAEANDPLAEVEITQAGSLTGDAEDRTATITVTAEDPEHTNEYSVTFRLRNTNASLSAIMLDGTPLDIFNPEVFQYLILLPNDIVDFPEVTATSADENATVNVGDLEAHPDVDNLWTVEILVTAEEEQFTQTYTVEFSYMDSEVALDEITINGDPLENFDPEVLTYEVTLPAGTTTIPVVDATPLSNVATVDIDQATELWGDAEDRTATITVTAEDPAFTRVYTIVFDVDATSVGVVEGISLNVFPNPASGTINVVAGEMIREVRLIDMLGQVVYAASPQSERSTIEVGQLKDGIYFVQVFTSQGITTQRVQIAR
jgi:hypothetical protein